MHRSGFDTDAESLQAASLDYGRVLCKRPRAVARATSANEVADIIRQSGRAGCPISFRGAAHSQGGQALSDGGIVLDMKDLNRIGDVEGGTIRVQGGARWRDLIRRVHSQGYLPMVMTSSGEATVGGTLSVAGLGATSHLYGAQTDSVEELEVVTGDGRLVRCSPTANEALFDCTRGGLGQFSAITEARIRLRKAPPSLRAFTLRYGDMQALMQALALVVSRGHFQGVMVVCLPEARGFWRMAAGESPFAERSYLVHLTAEINGFMDEDELLEGLRYDRLVGAEEVSVAEIADGSEPLPAPASSSDARSMAHPWVEGMLPWRTAERCVSQILGSLPRDVALGSTVLLKPLHGARFRTPMFMRPEGDLLMAFGVQPTVAPSELASTLPALDAAGRRLTAMGGKRYLSGWLDYDHTQWKAHYGERWPEILEWKEAFDPRRILNPDFVRYRPEQGR